uniref:Uncharacterized protein n=1 Tax=Panagrellus redivivus TaxID=6233 RepID=A0A7E4VR12_PANRE
MRSIFLFLTLFVASTWCVQLLLNHDFVDIAMTKDLLKVEFDRRTCGPNDHVCFCYKGPMKYSSMYITPICGHEAIFFCFSIQDGKLRLDHTEELVLELTGTDPFTFDFGRFGLMNIDGYAVVSPPELYPIAGEHDEKYIGIVKMAARGCGQGHVTLNGDFLTTLQTPPLSQLYTRPPEIDKRGKVYFMPGSNVIFVSIKRYNTWTVTQQNFACLCYESERPTEVLAQAKCPFPDSSQICFFQSARLSRPIQGQYYNLYVAADIGEPIEDPYLYQYSMVEMEYHTDPTLSIYFYGMAKWRNLPQPKFRWGYRAGSSKKERTIKLAAVMNGDFDVYVTGLMDGAIFDEPNQAFE